MNEYGIMSMRFQSQAFQHISVHLACNQVLYEVNTTANTSVCIMIQRKIQSNYNMAHLAGKP